MPITSLIFDLGGVLYPEQGVNIAQEVAAYAGITLERLEATIGSLRPAVISGQLTLLDLYSEASRRTGLRYGPSKLLARHIELYDGSALIQDPEIDALITQLQKMHKVACLTNTEPEIGEINRKRGIFDRFKPYDFVSTELGMRKPQPEIYMEALRRMESAPEEAVFIDDNPSYIEGANVVGLRVVLYKDFGSLERELRALGIL